jgi:hypothetical protein
MRINLEVPYEQRDLARRRGASWDKGRKTWFVENAVDLRPFLRWMPRHLTQPHSGSGKAFNRPTGARAAGSVGQSATASGAVLKAQERPL